jgi:hypothetical protein
VKGDFVVVGTGKDFGQVRQTTFKTTTSEKSTFNCLVGLKESHMVKLAHGLKAHEILLQDQPPMVGNSHLLTLMKFYYNVKKQSVIRNEMMVFYRHPQPTAQSP